MAWTFNQTLPIYLQTAHRIRSDIVCGRYCKNEKLPSVREFALTASVNPNTIQRAFGLLEEEGLVVTQGTAGRFVTADNAVITQARDAIAKQLVEEFAAKMTELGYSPEEATELTKSYYSKTSHINILKKEAPSDESTDS
ncbi:MAG: GntR family transcriptional regulator [Clostridiales bacterium]|jgi:GntR family transcriptional regulator|nr:GntR family transcriptional regulator [Clostridiales bacterium]